jgi:AcrR family transcriptional regulator
MSLAPAPPRPSKAERTRRQILEAAERRFAAMGFEKTRLDDVAEDVGLVGSAILYHFKDKRELYRAVRAELFHEVREAVREASTSDAPMGERLEAVVRATVRSVAARPAAASIALREAVSHDPDLLERASPVLLQVRALFEEGVAKGEIHPEREDPYHLISAVLGSVLFYTAALPRYFPDLPPDHLASEQMQALERDVVAMTSRLLGTDRPRARRRPAARTRPRKETP